MKTLNALFISALIFLSFTVQAQQVSVKDLVTLAPLEVLISAENEAPILTNAKGMADVSKLKGKSGISFSLIGYQTQVLSFDQLEKMNFEVYMTGSGLFMEEVVVSASRFEEKKEDVSQTIQVINSNDLRFMNQQSSADVLVQSGNVLVQKSQQGGGSPIIRGFEANKVLIVVDGVRMNNAIYRGGHLQDVITLDNTMMEKVEVVFGPGSVVYGSDALGGVMHFYTKRPILGDGETRNVNVNAFLRYASANQENTGHVNFNIGGKRFASLTSFTYSNFGDLRQGNNRNPFYDSFGRRDWYVERIDGIDSMVVNDNSNIQVGSGYKQYDLLQKFLFKQNDNVRHGLNIQYSTSSNIHRYDRLTEWRNGGPRFAEWYYGPQERLLAAYTLSLNGATRLYDRARVIASYQSIGQTRHQRNYRSVNLDNRLEEVQVLALNVDFQKDLGEHELRYGMEAVNNEVTSTAFRNNIETGLESPLDTRYPDGGSSMSFLAAYLTHSWEINEKLVLNDGLRLSSVHLNASFIDTTFYPFPFDAIVQNNASLNGSLGLIYMPGRDWRLTVLGSTGFRAPNVDDLAKVFESTPGLVIVPNADLKPEYVYTGEVGISKTMKDRVTLSGTGFYTIYTNAITTAPGTFNGASTIIYSGDTSNVITTVNANEAYIYGFNVQLQARINDFFDISSSVNYTYGRIKTDSTDYPLDHIPPVYGRTAFNLQLRKFRGEFFVMYSGWKRVQDYNMFGEDNFAFATPKGMPGWVTLNVRTSYQIQKNVQLQIALDNILDQNYRVFASNISAPGRSLVLTLRARV